MSTIGNFIWFCTLGWIGALLWAMMAVAFCWTPYAMSFLQMSKLYLAPFGKDIVSVEDIAKAKQFLKGPADNASDAATDDQLWSKTVSTYLKVPPAEAAVWVKRLTLAFNILWIPCGLALGSLALGYTLFLAISIVGLPFVPAGLRIARLSIWPIGKRVVDKRYADMIREALYKQALVA